MADPKQLTPEEKQKANKGCLTILAVAALIFGVWYFTKSNDKKEESTNQYVQPESSSSTSTAPSTQSPSSSSSSSSSIADKNPYEVIHIAFEGFPDKVKRLIREGHEPLGGILEAENIPHQSAPRAWFTIEADEHTGDLLRVPPGTKLHGRCNALSHPGGIVFADVVEILPP